MTACIRSWRASAKGAAPSRVAVGSGASVFKFEKPNRRCGVREQHESYDDLSPRRCRHG